MRKVVPNDYTISAFQEAGNLRKAGVIPAQGEDIPTLLVLKDISLKILFRSMECGRISQLTEKARVAPVRRVVFAHLISHQGIGKRLIRELPCLDRTFLSRPPEPQAQPDYQREAYA